ncbi:UPF0489 protein C5orf22 homolog [Penaeus monodon]|uniref:UPF0489 protein C5orf22 homolog n=1 Tax=Penaeus monodon TaxID=6687 RepID=UPI0018A73AE8|nr:UPF0489 protein C5orf22 homolog [Penaeus monodon]XP_037788005.1 UPF0489 protein C5orf22 homolog [Penaeus monodon]XP_037788006.1 UPF0489 protein C5orf22 homolog [Penaeus monodon]XP_037788007.1 UPF0489 protein C5orf22 homolog [Penaeus monodon]XP_037788008.1 UPF0489 protein C5orf22 homolog [Penaeus monodon]
MAALKKYSLLPVHIVEDHNDALYHILRVIGSKHLPFTHNLMIHFDSHPDLLIPAELKASEVFDVPIMLQKLSIENWVLPAVFAGQISTIVWIKPPWSNQIDEGVYEFQIGKQKETDQIKVSCPIMYYVGEMLFCRESELEDCKTVKLHVVTLGWEMRTDLGKTLCQLIEEQGGSYILDVDLDFFTTMNPFIEMHKKVDMYSRLRQIYSFDFYEVEEEAVVNAQVKRSNQISSLKKIFTSLHELKDPEQIKENVNSICHSVSSQTDRDILTALIKDLATEYGSEVDWEMIHEAGCTCDDQKHELPHHVSTDEQIVQLMECFQQLISSLPSPTVITLSRSSLDDYCPPDKVDMVQDLLCKFLRRTFDIDCKSHYLSDN